MRLELDVGNSFAKWRLVDIQGQVIQRNRFTSQVHAIDLPPLDVGTHVWVSSVAEEAFELGLISQLEERVSPERIQLVRSRPVMGLVRFAYEDVSTLGVDRCLAMCAAFEEVREGVVVIDAGSALTIDYVDMGGRHQGGYIVPGYQLLTSSLYSGTQRVRYDGSQKRLTRPGRSTQECVEHGLELMLSSTLSQALHGAMQYSIRHIYLCGGDSERCLSYLPPGTRLRPDLVLDGLSCAVGT